jgi:hypothetical protein
MIAVKKPVSVDFSNMSAGMNTAELPIAIGEHQVKEAYNAILKQRGFARAPGFKGLRTGAVMISLPMRGLHVYEQIDGTETLIASAGGGATIGALYSVNVSTGIMTALYTYGAGNGNNEAWMVNAQDKCWVVNANSCVKIENATTYLIGIAAPTGASAAALAGGSLAAGDYGVYVSYTRTVSGSDVLYSVGQDLGTVTLSGGNGSIRVTFPNSDDGQVNNKTVWITDTDAAVYSWAAETGDNSTTTVDITSDTRDTSKAYATLAAPNARPGALEGLCFFDNRLHGWIDNLWYWSEKGTNVYKYEIWRTTAVGRMPFKIISMFGLGDHLYMNTTGGMLRQPYGDVNSAYQIVDNRWYFRFPRTVARWGNVVIGMTNDGVRTFDGEKFSTFDFSKDIKPEIDRLYASYQAGKEPAGHVAYRDTRTEYHLSFMDTEVSDRLNNRHLVLNLSSTAVYDENKYKVPWEEWEGGFAYLVHFKDNTLYYAQSLENAQYPGGNNGNILSENAGAATDIDFFDTGGTFQTVATKKECRVQTRDFIPNIQGRSQWNAVRVMLQLRHPATIEVHCRPEAAESNEVSAPSGAVLGAIVLGTTRLTSTDPVLRTLPLKRNIAGDPMYCIFKQTEDDTTLNIVMLVPIGTMKKTRFT